MATERLSMRKIREILYLKWVGDRRNRQIAESLHVSVGKVSQVVRRATAAGLDWPRAEALSEAELEATVYGTTSRALRVPLPDPKYLNAELRKAGVTLQLLHLEYLEQHADGYRYTQFCDHYRRWLKTRGLVMRQVHRAGEKMFTDFAGKKPHWVNPMTGECHEAELFVAALGASNYTYAEAVESQKVGDWIGCHTRAVEYFGGCAQVVVPDQLKSGVTRSCRYEPEIQRTYEDWSHHYGTVIIPARPARPRDKAKVEVAVQVVERWILARLRNQSFFSLGALNVRIRELLEDLNARPMRDYGQSRRERFESLDRPALKTLPEQRFVYAEWKTVGVNIDYHVAVDHHFYSVPFALVRLTLDARISIATVEIFHKGERVAAHARSLVRGGFTTNPAHMPKAHQKHLEWSPARLVTWARKVGPYTTMLVEAILNDRPHPEQGYRSCLGLLRLARVYGAERLEVACARGLTVRARSYRHVESILKNGLDRIAPRNTDGPSPQSAEHENLRGKAYYQ